MVLDIGPWAYEQPKTDRPRLFVFQKSEQGRVGVPALAPEHGTAGLGAQLKGCQLMYPYLRCAMRGIYTLTALASSACEPPAEMISDIFNQGSGEAFRTTASCGLVV